MTGNPFDVTMGFVIGHRTNKSPSEVNVSVLAPAMFGDSFIALFNSNEIYIMGSGGAFKSAWNPTEISEKTGWADVTPKTFADIADLSILVHDPEEKRKLVAEGF